MKFKGFSNSALNLGFVDVQIATADRLFLLSCSTCGFATKHMFYCDCNHVYCDGCLFVLDEVSPDAEDVVRASCALCECASTSMKVTLPEEFIAHLQSLCSHCEAVVELIDFKGHFKSCKPLRKSAHTSKARAPRAICKKDKAASCSSIADDDLSKRQPNSSSDPDLKATDKSSLPLQANVTPCANDKNGGAELISGSANESVITGPEPPPQSKQQANAEPITDKTSLRGSRDELFRCSVEEKCKPVVDWIPHKADMIPATQGNKDKSDCIATSTSGELTCLFDLKFSKSYTTADGIRVFHADCEPLRGTVFTFLADTASYDVRMKATSLADDERYTVYEISVWDPAVPCRQRTMILEPSDLKGQKIVTWFRGVFADYLWEGTIINVRFYMRN